MAVSTFVFGQHEHAGRIDAQVRLAICVLEHRFDERACELGKLLVPRAERRLGEVELLAPVDVLEARERLVILPAAHDGVGKHRGAGETALDGQLDGGRGEHVGGSAALAIFAHELLVRDGDDHARSRSALEHLARIGADELERIESFGQHLRRQDFDRHARQRVGERLSDGFSAGMSRNRLLGLGLCWRRC